MKKFLLNKYALIIIIIWLILFFCLLFEINIFDVTYNFVINKEYQNEIIKLYNNNLFISYFVLIANLIKNSNFDYLIIWCTNIFQLLIPFYTIISLFYIKKTEKIKDIVIKSLKFSLCIFTSFILFYIFILLITKGETTNYIDRELFLDLLGKQFYQHHIYIYYLIDGIIKFFIVPFMYIFNANLIKITICNIDIYCFFIIYFYCGVSLLALFLENLVSNLFMYVNPMIFMASGSYTNISTLALFMSLIMFCLTGFIIYFVRRKKYEKRY